jgi:hypothetical protein
LGSGKTQPTSSSGGPALPGLGGGSAPLPGLGGFPGFPKK